VRRAAGISVGGMGVRAGGVAAAALLLLAAGALAQISQPIAHNEQFETNKFKDRDINCADPSHP